MRSFFLILFSIFSSVPAWSLNFGLPIDCGANKSCPLLIQNYVNTGCKEASYKGHKGTDFRLIYFSDVTKDGGVDVLASAPGKVTGVRNGMDDRLPPLDQAYIK